MQTILVDSLPPVVEQVRVQDGALWLETSEEVDSAALTAAATAGQLTLTPAAGGGPITLTAAQPVQEGLQARRRVVLTPATAPASGTSVELTLQPGALVDSFLNRPTGAFELTFDWPAGDAILQDTVPPRVEQVLVREGHIEIELSEEPDLTAASAVLQVNGQPIAWTLSTDRYTLKSVPAYDPGTYPLSISAAALDLAGLGLAEAFQKDVTVSAGLLLSSVSRRLDPRQIAISPAGNPFGFQGLPLDGETGFVYVRNRYYDSEMGRFISVDPLGYVDGPNPYGFAANDPVNGRDPLGLCVFVNKTVCEAITGFIERNVLGVDERAAWDYGDAQLLIAKFKREHGRAPRADEVVFDDAENHRYLSGDGRWRTTTGEIRAANDELVIVGVGLAARGGYIAVRAVQQVDGVGVDWDFVRRVPARLA